MNLHDLIYQSVQAASWENDVLSDKSEEIARDALTYITEACIIGEGAPGLGYMVWLKTDFLAPKSLRFKKPEDRRKA